MNQYDDVLSESEIVELIEFFQGKEYSVSNYKDTIHGHLLRYRNKHTFYDDKNSLVYKILYPKIYQLIGEHYINSGAFLESHYPFGLHVDTNQQFIDKSIYVHSAINKQKALIIPLVGSDKFNTVFFDHFTDTVDWPVSSKCDLEDFFIDGIDFSHFSQFQRDFVADKNISGVFKWTTGSIAVWPRTQLHCSSNFYNTGLVKLAITLFV